MRRLHSAEVPDSRAVCEALHRWLAGRPALKTIATFSAIRGEVDLSEITARHPERTWVYPRVAGDRLTFHTVRNPLLDLRPGAFGIREPSPALAEVALEWIDAFLCPGLAFDLRGGRLGRGRGFYDRMLAGARAEALKIGVGFPAQLVPDTFPEAHDIPMDEVLCGNFER